VCTTHFLEVFSTNLIKDGENGIKALNMAVHIPETTEEIAMPLFHLKEGVARSSAGLVCAKMAGVKREVIKRANEVIEAVKEHQQVKPLMEIYRSSLQLSTTERSLLTKAVKTDWSQAGDQEIEDFLVMVQQMYGS